MVMYGGAAVEEIEDIRDFHVLKHPYTRRLLEAGELENKLLETENALAMERIPEAEERESRTVVFREGCVYVGHCPNAEEKCFRERPKLVQREAGHRIACHLQ